MCRGSTETQRPPASSTPWRPVFSSSFYAARLNFANRRNRRAASTTQASDRSHRRPVLFSNVSLSASEIMPLHGNYIGREHRRRRASAVSRPSHLDGYFPLLSRRGITDHSYRLRGTRFRAIRWSHVGTRIARSFAAQWLPKVASGRRKQSTELRAVTTKKHSGNTANALHGTKRLELQTIPVEEESNVMSRPIAWNRKERRARQLL